MSCCACSGQCSHTGHHQYCEYCTQHAGAFFQSTSRHLLGGGLPTQQMTPFVHRIEGMDKLIKTLEDFLQALKTNVLNNPDNT